MILLFFWSPCYPSNAGRSNYSSSSTFYLFCLLNFTNNCDFRPQFSCLIVVYILIILASWNLKKGQWDGPHLIRWFPSVRHPVAQGQLCFALCYYWLLPFWWSPWLRRLWLACLCVWAVRVAVCSKSRGTSKQPRFMSIDIHLCARQPVLVIGSWGWRAGVRTPWQAGRHGRRMFGTSHILFLGYPIYLL